MHDQQFTWDDAEQQPTEAELARYRSPLAAWEQDRAVVEEAEQALTSPRTVEDGVLCVALLGRVNSGFGVQLLWDPLSGKTFVTTAVGGETETFEVSPEHALEAYEHPYAYGATLKL